MNAVIHSKRTFPTVRAVRKAQRRFTRKRDRYEAPTASFVWRGVERAWDGPYTELSAREVRDRVTINVSDPLWDAIAAHAKAGNVSVPMALEQILDHVLREAMTTA